jgi:hypothetical protein
VAALGVKHLRGGAAADDCFHRPEVAGADDRIGDCRRGRLQWSRREDSWAIELSRTSVFSRIAVVHIAGADPRGAYADDRARGDGRSRVTRDTATIDQSELISGLPR